MVQKDLEEITWNPKKLDNLSLSERQALKELKEAKNLTIKKSDKGGNVVLLDDDKYEAEVRRLLSDPDTYSKVERNPFPKVVKALNSILDDAKETGLLTKHEFDHLSVNEYNIPTFYCIPKVHKSLENPPGRPIVSAINGPLDRVGSYLDLLLKDVVYELKSYVQDTGHVLSKLAQITVEGEVWLIGIDVESLYTSIPHDCGIRAVKTFLELHYPQMAH